MPVLALAVPPPGHGLDSTTPKPTPVVHEAKTNGLASTVLTTLGPGDSDIEAKSKIPTLRLDLDVISDALAAKLVTSLIGHVLFLKSQVPFPVTQLARIPMGKKSNPRATKLRTELLDSFDTLSSHLNTTFTALSTAFARSIRTRKDETAPMTSRAYLAILVGPSLGSARSKIVVAIDGLDTKIWGLRDDLDKYVDEDDSSEDEEGEELEDGASEEDSEEDVDTVSETDEEDEEGDDDPSSPPLSRSPSPSPPTSPPRPPSHSAAATSYLPASSPEQQHRAADRLLSHTLATAEYDMASEMAPTQTHILIRAPRRFVHPAWIPRQNVSGMLEGALGEFLNEAGVTKTPISNTGKSSSSNKRKVEGVWVGCRATTTDSDLDSERTEDDEMIWWSWDGKIIGFADW